MGKTSKKITIAIDGHSSCGKSTLAKAIANDLNYAYLDSGAMYRGVALFALQNNLIKAGIVNKEALISEVKNINLNFVAQEGFEAPVLHVNGVCAEPMIRSMEVSNNVSKIAIIKEVREKLVDEQRKMGTQGGVVMDGRDIGSVVFPDAELKLFVTAKPEVRAQRRFDELIAKGDDVTLKEVAENLRERDHIGQYSRRKSTRSNKRRYHTRQQ